MSKKYELTDETLDLQNGSILHRIRALRDLDIPFFNVKKGDLGGWVESESNLSQEGDCWIADDAMVHGNAVVRGNAKIYDNVEIFDNAIVHGNAKIYKNSIICGNAEVYCNSFITNNCCITGDSEIYGDVYIKSGEHFCYDADISSNKDYLYIDILGNTLTFFLCKDNSIKVSCSLLFNECFLGTLDEFEHRVILNHEEKISEEYLMIVDLVKKHFNK